MMFVVDQQYEITTGYGEDLDTQVFTVVAVDLPLIQANGPLGHEYTFNTHSPNFVSAKRPSPGYQPKPSIYKPVRAPSDG
ncbi:hypothetical protein ABIC16_000265 [Sphingomonas sp. PvP055]|uniref:hypothetical protein n=1 Tax=Sphingomonas sp. PvP055 TaxID=3156391 RepID=UPI00339384B0